MNEDQVPRLLEFQRQHPEIQITPPDREHLMWTARRGEVEIASAFWLGTLLNDLEKLT